MKAEPHLPSEQVHILFQSLSHNSEREKVWYVVYVGVCVPAFLCPACLGNSLSPSLTVVKIYFHGFVFCVFFSPSPRLYF